MSGTSSRPYKRKNEHRELFHDDRLQVLEIAFEIDKEIAENPTCLCRSPSCSTARCINSARTELESQDKDKIEKLKLQPQKAAKTRAQEEFLEHPGLPA